MTTELIFKDIPDYPNYKISYCGKYIIRKEYFNDKGYFIKEKIISQSLHRGGYLKATIVNSSGSKTKLVHRLVALTFIPNPENKREVNHKDTDKTNCHVDNLEWMTSKENKEHAILHNLTARGTKNGNCSITEDVAINIKKDLTSNSMSNLDISKKYNVSKYIVSRIKTKKTWNY